METTLTTVIGYMAVGVGLGISLVLLYAWYILRKFNNQIKIAVKDAVKEIEQNLVGIIVEEDNGQLFFYREEDKQFLCQGKDIAEVRQMFNKTYPEKIAYFAGGDPALIERLKAELEVIKEQEKSENRISV